MKKFKQEHLIRFHECSYHMKLKVSSALNMFQDIASNHANQLNIGYDYCSSRQMTWVAIGYHVKIKKLPSPDEKTLLTTWISDVMTAKTSRCFSLKSSDGKETFITATSYWALLDLKTLRPLRIRDSFPNNDIFNHVGSVINMKKIEPIEKVTYQKEKEVCLGDIDVNRHMNNAFYVDWAIDGLPLEFYEKYTIKELNILYKKSALLGERVLIKVYRHRLKTLHQLVNADNPTQIYAILEFRWAKRGVNGTQNS